MENNSVKNVNEKKKRSKAAKIVLWSLLGCVAAVLVVMIVWIIVAACGGTGTINGGLLGLGWNVLTTVFGIFVVLLVAAWMLTEPSFKKEEVIEIEVKPQYVKKSARPQPVKKAESPAEDKPADGENN